MKPELSFFAERKNNKQKHFIEFKYIFFILPQNLNC